MKKINRKRERDKMKDVVRDALVTAATRRADDETAAYKINGINQSLNRLSAE